jgi:hypothetical protein
MYDRKTRFGSRCSFESAALQPRSPEGDVSLQPALFPSRRARCPPVPGQARLIAWALITRNLFALLVTFIFEVLSLRSVVHLVASRFVLALTWITAEIIVAAFV